VDGGVGAARDGVSEFWRNEAEDAEVGLDCSGCVAWGGVGAGAAGSDFGCWVRRAWPRATSSSLRAR
jgi:hypothetical protein